MHQQFMSQQFLRPSGEISMIRLLLSSSAFAILLAGGPALAADQRPPVFTKAPMIPVFSWTGFYVGANAGGHWGRDSITTTTALGNFNAASVAKIDASSPTTLKPQGWLAGAQIGYNVEVNHVVLGFEGDADWLNGTNSRSLVFPGPNPTAGDVLSNSTQGTFLATLRPRIGAAYDRALFYITGGLAVGTVKTTDSFAFGGGTVLETNTTTTTRVGWAAGGGFEYAFYDNWSVKIEGLHVNLGGTYDVGIPCLVACPASTTDIVVHHRYTDNIARVGLNYRFGFAPVVAKY
jgi:outer membrane immunogenic protein